MAALALPKPLEEDIRWYIRRTVYTKTLQEEIREFFDDRINPNLKVDIIAQIFREILINSKIFMQLRVIMREDFKLRRSEHANAKESVNRLAFTETADEKFNIAINNITRNITVHYTIPEQKVLHQNAANNGEMYVILNGVFDVQNQQYSAISRLLNQNKKKLTPE